MIKKQVRVEYVNQYADTVVMYFDNICEINIDGEHITISDKSTNIVGVFPSSYIVYFVDTEDNQKKPNTSVGDALRELFPNRTITPPYTTPYPTTITWNDGVCRDHFPTQTNPQCEICNGRNPC